MPQTLQLPRATVPLLPRLSKTCPGPGVHGNWTQYVSHNWLTSGTERPSKSFLTASARTKCTPLAGAAGGAALGAIMGDPGKGAAIGAATGGIGGGAYTGVSADQKFKQAFNNCMRSRGHNVVN